MTCFGLREAADGLRGHDLNAWTALIPSLTAPSHTGGWTSPTWLVATGDLTTWGDDASLAPARAVIQAAASKLAIPFCIVYGNHDVWPGKSTPLSSPPGTLGRRRSRFRRRFFPWQWPLLPITDQTSGGGGLPMVIPFAGSRRIVGVSLNTVVHGRVLNGLAFGTVKRDYYWQKFRAPLTHQLRLLRGVLKSGDIGLIFTHHPVYYPPPKPLHSMFLLNDTRVARALGLSATAIVISGHTHQVYPPLNQLPPATNLYSFPPLRAGHIQLIGGTTTHISATKKRWERLRFFEDPSTGRVWLERAIYEYQTLLRSFEQVQRGGAPVTEWMEIY